MKGFVLALGLCAWGCGGTASEDDDGDGAVDAGSAECGDSTCNGQEICIIRQSGPFAADAPDTRACAPAPAGCSPSRLCDCEVESWEGEPVTGCSLLGERSLYVTDTSCGTTPPCGAAEACMAEGSPFDEIGPASCQPLPDGCTVSEDFCDDGCAQSVATAAGRAYAGCAAAAWAVGVYVSPP